MSSSMGYIDKRLIHLSTGLYATADDDKTAHIE